MKSKIFTIIKILLVISAVGCTASVVLAGHHYMHTDPRFNLRMITIVGLQRVEESDVLGRVNLKTNSNTNIFAVNMEDVRAHVEQIQWVRYATVERILPDQIIITVVERQPIGLARIQGLIYEFDSDATILDQDSSSSLHLPILIGLQENDRDGNLAKIAMYQKVLAAIDAKGISDIKVNQSNEVSVVREEDTLIVNLGVEDFKERWSRYLALKGKIDEFKDAVVVDLRFRNRVVVSMHDDEDGGKVIWDGKKKSL